MSLSPTIQSTLLRYQPQIVAAMRNALRNASDAGDAINRVPTGGDDILGFYGQMQYHLGWVDADYAPVTSNPGKLLRPTLLLLAYEASGAEAANRASQLGDPRVPSQPHTTPATTETINRAPTEHLRRALPAAAALEMVHNFTLIHDDIEDRDAERRHRPTLWKQWGIPQAINTGDGMFALARLALWDVLNEGVESDIAVQLGALLDQACLVIAEGQYLDISFEGRLDISVSMYLDMIRRKTAALMECAARMGAVLGTRDSETIDRLGNFGRAIGIAFQVRDDVLGVWATTEELGKAPAGDIYRRKKSLPVLYAMEHASAQDRQLLQQIYSQEAAVTGEQVTEVLAIFARTQTQAYCNAFLTEQCKLAYEALASVPRNDNLVAARALDDMQALVRFVESTTRE